MSWLYELGSIGSSATCKWMKLYLQFEIKSVNFHIF